MTVILIQGNALDLPLADASVDLVVTSPPYFGLRSYQDGGEHYAGQIGSEATPAEFVDALLAATTEMVRVLKPSGSIWVNLGDKYASYEGNRGPGGKVSGKVDPGRNSLPSGAGLTGGGAVKSKSLFGIPWRYAIRCIDDLGLILRAEMIWSKPNGLPESVTDRVRRSHEQWFHFTKSPRYFSAVDEIREPVKYPDDTRHLRGGRNLHAPGAHEKGNNSNNNPLGKLPGSVWEIATQPLKVPASLGIDHFAAFPMEWPRRIIKAWSPTDGVVLDPFGGTGTTAMVAAALGRRGISVDMSADYNRLAAWRTTDPKQLDKAANPKPPKKKPDTSMPDVTPYCDCNANPRGYRLDPATNVWGSSCCGRPTRTVYEKSINRDTVPVQEPGSSATPGGHSMLKVSNSELQTLKRCRRKWWLGNYRRLRPIHDGVGPLSVGNMIHHPLEVYYALSDRDPAIFDWSKHLAAYFQERLEDPRLPADLHPAMREDYELAKLMLEGYFEWLQAEGADSEIEVIAAEREVEVYFDTILGTPVYLISKLDTEVRLKSSGLRGFIDHKSVQNLTDLEKSIEINEQLRYYGMIQRMEAVANGTGETEFAHGGMLNMLRKVKRTFRANPPFYGRAGVTHNDEVYRTFYARVWGEVYDLLTLRARLDAGADHHQVAYPTPTRDCAWDCPFRLICPRFDDGSDVEAIIAEQYEEHDPLERYTEVEKG